MSLSECRVPQELIEAIIRNLDGDQRSLARCARVSVRFLTLSRGLLYKRIILEPPIYRGKPNPRSVRHFHSVISSYPSLVNCVEDLTISHKGPLFTWPDMKAMKWLSDPSDTSLLEVMTQLKNIRKLKIAGLLSLGRIYDSPVDWMNLSEHSLLALGHARSQFQHLTVLHLHCVSNFDVEFFDFSRNLQELVLDAVTFAPWRLDDDYASDREPRPDRSQLKKLCIHTCNGESSLHFVRYLTSHRVGLNISNLEFLHYTGDRFRFTHRGRLYMILRDCRSSLIEFEFSPSLEKCLFEYPELSDFDPPATFSRFTNLRILSLSLHWEICNEGSLDSLEWFESRLTRISYFNRLEVFRLRFHLEWIDDNHDSDSEVPDEEEALDWGIEMMSWWKWEDIDKVLSNTAAFPELRRVEIYFIPDDGNKRPLPIEELYEEIHANLPELSQRTLIYVYQGCLRSMGCIR
ncbi:hypothetical protein D9756_008194 [Leucocoprinus leucothites]|uniref:F-box domain-containing protein n=1 Tax=Leucocoprinus leucothites TaxID=201217 RepID=A0A8H5D020_9AGAR|nr:hypothetical protein D9756_008194 [Leucoagaricus leucothites]